MISGENDSELFAFLHGADALNSLELHSFRAHLRSERRDLNTSWTTTKGIMHRKRPVTNSSLIPDIAKPKAVPDAGGCSQSVRTIKKMETSTAMD